MKRLKRTFLKVDERIYFGVKKGSSAERYFDKNRFNITDNFYLYIDYGNSTPPKDLTITFIYHDEKFVEYIIQKQLKIQSRNGRMGKCEIKLLVIVQQEGKALHKIKFENLPITESSLYICISEL